MIRKSKHLEALIRKHWRTLLLGGGNGLWLDGYNCIINDKVSGTIKTNLDTSNIYFILDRREDEKRDSD